MTVKYSKYIGRSEIGPPVNSYRVLSVCYVTLKKSTFNNIALE
jgi:hypothetical protein